MYPEYDGIGGSRGIINHRSQVFEGKRLMSQSIPVRNIKQQRKNIYVLA